MNDARTIIILEDETMIRNLIAKTLRRHGYQVEESADGTGALDHLRNLVDQGVTECLMILDLIVPNGMGGRETLSKAREIAPGVRAIIASGYSDDEKLEALVEPGRTQLLAKPYNVQELLSIVEALA